LTPLTLLALGFILNLIHPGRSRSSPSTKHEVWRIPNASHELCIFVLAEISGRICAPHFALSCLEVVVVDDGIGLGVAVAIATFGQGLRDYVYLLT